MSGCPLPNLRAFGHMVCPGGFLDRKGIKFKISALCRAMDPRCNWSLGMVLGVVWLPMRGKSDVGCVLVDVWCLWGPGGSSELFSFLRRGVIS